jgi:hypothetical protein
MNQAEQVFELEWGQPGGDPVPVGQHVGEFLGLEPVPATERDGKRLEAAIRFRFRVCEGDHADKVAAATGPVRPTEKNRSGRLLSSMGVAVGKPGQTTSIKDLIGRKFNIIVGLSQGGKPIVEFAFPKK